MKNIVLLLILGCMGMVACNDQVPVPIENTILFKATCDTKCAVSAFVDRDSEIVWQVNDEFTSTFELEHTLDLEPGDKVLLFVLPKDGKHHVIETEIFVDGELQANQSKVCHAGGGCSFTEEGG